MYRILQSGIRIEESGLVVAPDSKSPVFHAVGIATGTQLQSGGEPATISPFFSIPLHLTEGKALPIGWNVFFDAAGGAVYSGNTTLRLCNNNGEELGLAIAAISASPRHTVGSITGGAFGAVYDSAFELQVKTGNPTGTNAGAKAYVHVQYVII